MRADDRRDAVSELDRIEIGPMSQEDAETIAEWSYPTPYDFYDAKADADDLRELLEPTRRRGMYFSARQPEGELVGFFQFRRSADVVDIGLGLRPDLTGRGLGSAFLDAGLAFARETFSPRRFTLSVAAFNLRAIAVYERAGFVLSRTFEHETNGGVFSFVEMERPA